MRIPTLKEIVLSFLVLTSPKIANAIDGIVLNPLTGEGIPNAYVELSLEDTFVDSTRTNEDGLYQIGVNSVELPKYNVNLPSIEKVYLTDIQGRLIHTLKSNELTRNIPSKFNLPSGIYILKADNGNAVSFPTTGRSNIPFDPFNQLVKTQELENRVKNRNNSISSSDEGEYILKVSDDNIEHEIGDFYDAHIPLGVEERDDDRLNMMKKDVQLIPNYQMQDWDGDFLEYLSENVQPGGTTTWGDYPNNYPINVDLDSASCSQYCGDRTELYLRAIRNALNRWNEKSNLDLFNYTNITEDNRQIIVDYSQHAHFVPHQVRDEDGRYRYYSGVVYLYNWYHEDSENELQILVEHEFGHATGWRSHSPHMRSVMYDTAPVHISDDDGKVVETFTNLPNFTSWSIYLQE